MTMATFSNSQLLALYRCMYLARQIDRVEQEITSRGEAFFQLSGSGHEATAALANYLHADDWLHCHYRSRALLLARGIPARQFFDSLLCNAHSTSQGRRMSAFFSDPDLHVLSMVTPVGNNALQAVGVAEAVRDQASQPLVLCGIGDGTTQQGEFYEACGEASRRKLPVLFLIENNRWAISTSTQGATFFDQLAPSDSTFLGLPVSRVDGRDVLASSEAFERIVGQIRRDRGPQLVVLDVERLTSHTSADDHTTYRTPQELAASRAGDPLQNLRDRLLARGVTSLELDQLHADVLAEVAEAERLAFDEQQPAADPAAKKPLSVELTHPSRERTGQGEATIVMRQAIRDVLQQRLAADPRVVVFGEDIEDPKGDVFGVTRGLSTQFPGRVLNSPLSESTIVGVSVGRALAGQRPVAMIQFADFLPLAHNQIMSELAMMYWRTAGRWEAPVIMMAACGAYRPGLGPYHAQTTEGTFAHIPGLDVFMPSTAADAAGMLQAAFASERPTLFLYPKAILNDESVATSQPLSDHFVPIGPARKVRAGRDITFVGWGNTVALCQQVSKELERVGVDSEIIDLRSLSPWDERTVLASAEKTARLVVVHEDNHTAGFGAEVVATIAEKARVPVVCRRVTRPDTFVPCHFGNQLELLPSFQRLLNIAAELLDLDVKWEQPQEDDGSIVTIDAVGSGPSDDRVELVQWLVEPGHQVKRGTPLASVEASKSVFDMTCTVDGTVLELLAQPGESVPVGQPIARVECAAGSTRRKISAADKAPIAILSAKPKSGRLILPRSSDGIRQFDVGMSQIATVEGSRIVLNQDLLSSSRRRTDADILRRTGIERRHWVVGDEDAITMAVRACEQVMERENLILDDIDLMVCSTTSPTSVTPSMACRVLNRLAAGKGGEAMLQAFDINAACSGYLYALQAGYDYLQSRPQSRVLVVTTEVLSPLLDPNDFDTAILFGDAASATVLYGEADYDRAKARLHRPELSAKSDVGGVLSVPLLHDGFIQMQGRKVFTEAVRTMVSSLNRACQIRGMNMDQLDLIVPHQANQRILDAIQHRISPQVYSNIRMHGNTSSSSIPLCLADIFPTSRRGDRYGLCAFGGGFTFGASIVEMN
jgi:2-oxoisovalerate dehydrogenase E1 component